MEPTAKQIMDEIGTVSDNVTALLSDRLTCDDLAHAVASGLRTAISDPAFWDSAMAAMTNRARNEAGGWLLGGLRAIASKAAWIIVLGGAIYLVGGWSAVVAAWKAHQ